MWTNDLPFFDKVPESGAEFRFYLEKNFPIRGGEGRKRWFFRLSSAIGIPASRLEKLSYNDKCAIKAEELVRLQRAVSGRITDIQDRANALRERQRGTEDEGYRELLQIVTDIFECPALVAQQARMVDR